MTAPLTTPTETWEQDFDRIYDAQVERQERHDRECTRRQELLAAFEGDDLWTAPEGFGRALTMRERIAIGRAVSWTDVRASAENGWTDGDEAEENDKLEALLHAVRSACADTGRAMLNEIHVRNAIERWAGSIGIDPHNFVGRMFAPQPNTGPWTPKDWAVVKAERAKGRPPTPDEKAMITGERANDTSPAKIATLAKLAALKHAPRMPAAELERGDQSEIAKEILETRPTMITTEGAIWTYRPDLGVWAAKGVEHQIRADVVNMGRQASEGRPRDETPPHQPRGRRGDYQDGPPPHRRARLLRARGPCARV